MIKTILDYPTKQKPSLVAILVALIESWEGLRHAELKSITGLEKTCFDDNRKVCLENGWIKKKEDGRYIIQPVGVDAYRSYSRIAIYKRDIPDEDVEFAPMMVPLTENRIKVGKREYVQSAESGYCRLQSDWPDDRVDDAVQEVMRTIGSEAMTRDGFEILNALNKKGVAVKNMTFCWAASLNKPNQPFTVEEIPVKIQIEKSKKSSHAPEDGEWIERGVNKESGSL